MIADMLDNTNQIILNDGSPTLIKPPNTTPSSIDLTLATADIATKMNWAVIEDEISSNHKIIIFELQHSFQTYNSQQEIINKKNAIKFINTIDINQISDQFDLVPKIKQSK